VTKKSVKVIAAFCGVAAIGTLAVRACGGNHSSSAPDQVVLRGSETGLKQRAGLEMSSSQPTGWIAKSGGVPSEGGHGAAAPQATLHGSRDSLAGVGSTTGSQLDSSGAVEPSADDPIRVQASVPTAAVRAIGNEGAQTGMTGDVPEPEAASNSGGTADSPTPPEDSANPTPARRGSFFASMNFGVNSETLFPEPDADFSPISIADNTGTISFCLQQQWSGGAGNLSLISTSPGAANSLSVAKDGQYLRFALADSTGLASTAAADINAWQPGQRHLVTTTWGSGQTLLYVDGKLVDQQAYQGQLQGQLQLSPDSPLHIGSAAGDVAGAGGSLSQLQIQDRVMSESDIADLTSGCQ